MKKVILGILVFIILIQFLRPDKNDSKNYSNDYTTVLNVPNEVKEIIKASCADCHSNYTEYPWYSNIAPVSWYLAQHVNNGKEHLNFSEWANYNDNQKEHIIKDLKEVIESHEMPLKSYLLLHKESELTEDQYGLLMDWVQSISK